MAATDRRGFWRAAFLGVAAALVLDRAEAKAREPKPRQVPPFPEYDMDPCTGDSPGQFAHKTKAYLEAIRARIDPAGPDVNVREVRRLWDMAPFAHDTHRELKRFRRIVEAR